MEAFSRTPRVYHTLMAFFGGHQTRERLNKGCLCSSKLTNNSDPSSPFKEGIEQLQKEWHVLTTELETWMGSIRPNEKYFFQNKRHKKLLFGSYTQIQTKVSFQHCEYTFTYLYPMLYISFLWGRGQYSALLKILF